MTLTAAVSNATQVLTIVPREYEVFGGLNVDHHSIVASFADHGKLMQLLRVPSLTLNVRAQRGSTLPSPKETDSVHVHGR